MTTVVTMSETLGPPLLRQVTAAAADSWAQNASSGLLSPSTAAVYRRQLESFEGFAGAHGVTTLADVTDALCELWIRAPHPRRGGLMPTGLPVSASASTMRLRHGVLTAAVRSWLDSGLMAENPLPSLCFERQPRKPPAPLTPPEAVRVRTATLQGTRDRCAAVAVAAALAGAAQSEIARLTIADFDLDAASLRLVGRGRSGARIVRVGPAGVTALEARLRELARELRHTGISKSSPHTPLALRRPLDSYSPHAVAPAIASTLSRSLGRAGITRPGVRSGSFRDYAANRIYALTGRVEDVADVVGIASLDLALRLIVPEWQAQWAETARLDEG